MNRIVFLTVLFLPFIFFLFLSLKRLTLSYVNKKVLDFGLILSVIPSLIVSVIQYLLSSKEISLFLITANIIFLFLAVNSFLFFKLKKQFMFTKVRYNIFLSLLMSLTYLFILSDNLLLTLIFWIMSGILIYLFSYFDIFKTTSDYDSSRFYSIFLTGDFCLLIACILLMKYAVISNNYSYLLNFEDIKSLLSYTLGNDNFEFLLISSCLIVSLFSRSFTFPFSCFFSFLTNASGLLYLTVYSIISPLYSLVLFLKLDIFNSVGQYFKYYFIIALIICFISLLFEKHFKIIFGYILSILNTGFILIFFFNPSLALIAYAACFGLILIVLCFLFLGKKLSFKRSLININKGFIQERLFIFVSEKLPVNIASIIEFSDKTIFKNILALFIRLFDFISFHYLIFTQKRKVKSILKGILIIFSLFAILAIFIALFGNFGEIQI